VCFAHIRAASLGMPLSEFNCHPFRMGKFMWMHNGGIAHYNSVKRSLLAALPPNVYKNIQGTTDSEVSFGIFMSQFPDQGIHGPGSQYVRDPSLYYSPKQIEIAMRNTVVTIMEAHKKFGYVQKEAASSLNFACTDGETIVALRCRTHDSQDPPTLYYACSDDEFTLQGSGKRTMITPPKKRSPGRSRPLTPRTSNLKKQITLSSSDSVCSTFIIASEPLDYVDTKWHLVPKDTMVIVANDTLQLIPLDLPNYDDIGKIMLTPAFTAFDDSSSPNFEDKDSNFSLLHKIDTKSISVGGDGINTLINNSKDDNKGKKRNSSRFKSLADMNNNCNMKNNPSIFRTLARTPRYGLSKEHFKPPINQLKKSISNNPKNMKKYMHKKFLRIHEEKNTIILEEEEEEEEKSKDDDSSNINNDIISFRYILAMCALSFSIGMLINQK